MPSPPARQRLEGGAADQIAGLSRTSTARPNRARRNAKGARAPAQSYSNSKSGLNNCIRWQPVTARTKRSYAIAYFIGRHTNTLPISSAFSAKGWIAKRRTTIRTPKIPSIPIEESVLADLGLVAIEPFWESFHASTPAQDSAGRP